MIGRLIISVRARSLPCWAFTPIEIDALPVSTIRWSGWAACAAAVAASTPGTTAFACSGLLESVTGTRTTVPLADSTGSPTATTPGTPRIRAATSAATVGSGAPPPGAVSRICSTSGGASPVASAAASACPASPTRKSATTPLFFPISEPAATQIATNTSQPTTACHGWRALHVATRTTGPRSAVMRMSLAGDSPRGTGVRRPPEVGTTPGSGPGDG